MRAVLSLVPLLHVCLATTVYFSPPRAVPAKMLPARASVTLAHHLGVEAFEPLDVSFAHDFEDPEFVAQGQRSGLLLSVNELDIEHVVPTSFKPTFKLMNSPAVDSFSSLISTYLARAQHAYVSIFSTYFIPSSPTASSRLLNLFDFTTSPEMEQFYSEIAPLASFLDAADNTPSFAAIELSGLAQLREAFGVESQEYQLAAQTTRAAVESALAQSSKLHVALLTFRPTLEKRQTQSPFPVPTAFPQPIGSVSSCFASADACSNSTNTCSGRGECVQTSKAGKTCFVCACSSTTSSSGSTDFWVGEKCERKDVSGPFTLLAGTTIVMIIIAVGSIYLLATIGNQELPSVLMGGAVHAKRD